MKSFYQSSLVALIMVFVLLSCQPEKKESKFLSEIVTKQNVTSIFKQLRDDKDFTTQDYQYLTNGMTRLVTMSIDSLLGKSVGEIIKLQQNFERDQTAATAANQATKVELVMNHDFKYLGLKPELIAETQKDVDFLYYEVTNKSDKEISNLQGVLQFMDTQNNIVKIYPIVLSNIIKDGVIKPGEMKRFMHPFDHDAANVRDQQIRNDHRNLRPIWICTMIEFKDGSKISVTNTL
ncbi:hypothetical protein MASR1M45_06480 [Candidatus Kapaibacterium sp.]